ncbi:precorrin-3B C(17)-methyltransferase [Actinacidiphila sp. ITFR-21]|uniref:precorrin-3B C(17)-methyltransferase n=1 Tax=Actinacidiphila sp. ITFR-21 TaxID=3075199 RepID=UPI00288A10E8|nr:precorrin-3B C(17)-methyltransferase [Streptomyces sp. ITFR-21]WNI14978.1 precorrin-3B C(17)-methyltransferase [Streptomyces sp. ITFR-21]
MIGLIAATAAGRRGSERLAAAWPGRTRIYEGAVGEVLPRAFGECDRLVLFLATGAAVRLLAPLLTTKRADPAVVTVDEAHRHAVALLGGHARGANALAVALTPLLGTSPVITTATDSAGTPALDTLPYPAEGALAAVTRAMLDSRPPVHLRADATWPLPPLPLPSEPDAAPPAPPAPAADSGAREAPQPGDGFPGPGATPPVATVPPPRTAVDRNGPGEGFAATTAGGAATRTAGFRATGPATPPETLRGTPPDASAPRRTGAPDQDGAGHRIAAATAGRGTARDGRAGTDRAGDPPAEGTGGAAPAAYLVWVTDRVVDEVGPTVYVRPPSLVVGVGASRGVGEAEVRALIEGSLAGAGLALKSVAALATVAAKAREEGIVRAAAGLEVPLLVYEAAALAAVTVPHPSAAPLAAVGTPSVAEAAALLGAPGGELVVEKRKSAMATVAVARRRPRGRLAVVGLGPGARDLLTPRAAAELRRASVIVGLDQYVEQVRDLLPPGARVLESGLGAEEERARTAVAAARAGHAVALIGSGDAGVYAMASPALAEAGDDIDVVGVPGVTAALAAAALLGAPLGHDHVSISLSDLHTPWEVIERRVLAAAVSDLVVTFYNPRSRGRAWQLPKALSVLAGHRAPATPVGVVRAASRPDERAEVTTLAELDVTAVDMVTVVTVGNTATRNVAGRMVTPRGYRWQS